MGLKPKSTFAPYIVSAFTQWQITLVGSQYFSLWVKV